MDCTNHAVAPPKIVAIATDKYLTPEHDSQDKDLPGPAPKYGQDFTFGVGRAAPGGKNVGRTVAALKPKMEFLLRAFADGDDSGMAKRLFDKFLAKQDRVYYFEDADLNAAAAKHGNILYFCNAALGAPHPFGVAPAPGKTRIHQALKAAGWDISKLIAPTDLGVPAFNDGSKARSTGDFDNGLGLMINGVQHAYVIATHYHYDKTSNVYCIILKHIFYDVFGLDDDDLREYGADDDSGELSFSRQGQGITAWWQLQHQHGYAPLVTRIVVTKSYHIPAI
jgi:hypothetical protein